jgi:hypothetical protein
MKNKVVILSLISFLSLNLYSNNINYVIPITSPKINKINISLKYKQHMYDLIVLNKELELLFNNDDFKSTSNTLEMDMKLKNNHAYYTTDYIENLLKVLNGIDPYNDFHILNNQGYIREVKDDFNKNYKMYLNNINNNLIDNSLEYRYKRIQENLDILSNNLKDGKDVREPSKNIYEDLIYTIQQVISDAIELKKYGLLQTFNRNDDYKYKIPTNWGQYGTTIIDILNFVLNGSHKNGFWGIKDYYKKELLDKENSKLIID